MRRDRLYLSDMLEACEDVDEFISEVSYDDFIKDKLRTSAVLQKLMVIGEAARVYQTTCGINILT